MPKGAYKRSKSDWNKGLTKETDARVAKNAAAISVGVTESWKDSEIRVNHIVAMSIAHMGVPLSPEHCTAISAGLIGKSKSPEHCKAISDTKIGISLSLENIVGLIKSHNTPEYLEANSGENHWNWQGGVTPLYELLHNIFKYKKWRFDVFTRDNYTCQKCGDNSGGNLEAHHKKPFIVILHENNIITYETAINCVELWDINNGITLCKECHKKEQKLTMELIKNIRKN
jgi:hypothetical protein